jgi:hypothetical protein
MIRLKVGQWLRANKIFPYDTRREMTNKVLRSNGCKISEAPSGTTLVLRRMGRPSAWQSQDAYGLSLQIAMPLARPRRRAQQKPRQRALKQRQAGINVRIFRLRIGAANISRKQ